jgi:hypothetical protein
MSWETVPDKGGMMLAVLWAFVSANALSIGIKVLPIVLLAGLVLAEWFTSSVFGRAGIIVLVISTIAMTLDIAGKLPTITLPATPAKPSTPTS